MQQEQQQGFLDSDVFNGFSFLVLILFLLSILFCLRKVDTSLSNPQSQAHSLGYELRNLTNNNIQILKYKFKKHQYGISGVSTFSAGHAVYSSFMNHRLNSVSSIFF